MQTHPYTSKGKGLKPDVQAKTYRLKRRYARYLQRAKGLDSKTIDHRLKAVDHFLDVQGSAGLEKFNGKLAMGYVDFMLNMRSKRTGQTRNLATVAAELGCLKNFLIWLNGQNGYKRCYCFEDVEYLSLNRKDLRAALANTNMNCPSMVECKKTFSNTPSDTEVAMRNRALFALLMLTGARIEALTTLQLGHVSIREKILFQSGWDSNIKGSKTFYTAFFPVGKCYLKEIKAWVKYLRNVKGFKETDPLFPKSKRPEGKLGQKFSAIGKEFYKSPSQLSKMVSSAFEPAINERHGPHSIRKTLVAWLVRECRSEESRKAASLNLGHKNLKTTYDSYYGMSTDKQIELVLSIGKKKRFVN